MFIKSKYIKKTEKQFDITFDSVIKYQLLHKNIVQFLELPIAKLNLKPSRSDMKILLNHIGKETFQLGIELGLSVVEMHQIQSNHVTNLRGQTEEVLCKWRKQHHATYEVLVKTLYRLDLAGVVESLTYEVGVNEQIEGIYNKVDMRTLNMTIHLSDKWRINLILMAVINTDYYVFMG